MYTYIGLGLMSVFAMMITPGNFDTVDNGLVFYGAGTITQYDKDGNEVISQTVHNQLVNTGEDFMLQGTFDDGSADVTDNLQVGSICISNDTTMTVAETENATTFEAGNTIVGVNCKEDATVDLVTEIGIATINPPTFTCGGVNCVDGTSVEGFGICQNSAGGDFTACTTNGILFAVIDSLDTVLNAGETLDITYNFNVTSPNS